MHDKEGTATESIGKVKKFFTSISVSLAKQTLQKLNTDETTLA